MYNAKIKKRYIEYNPNNNHQFERILTNYFNRAEKSETIIDKDLSKFTSAEILDMYKSFCTSLDMLVVIHNQFLNYSLWYMNEVENIDNQNHYSEIRDDMLIQCISFTAQEKKIITREEVLSMTNDFANPYESFLYLALFEGLSMSDFEELRMSNFNRKAKKVILLGRTLNVSKELIHYAEESSEEYQIYNIEGNPVHRGKLLKEDDRIIKCSESSGLESCKEERTRIIYRTMTKIKRYDFVSPSISITSLIESGRVHMIKELMKKAKSDNVEEVLRKYRKEIEVRYGHISSAPKWLLKYETFCKQ